jgi:hypothetical protein
VPGGLGAENPATCRWKNWAFARIRANVHGPIYQERCMVVDGGHILFRMRRFRRLKNISRFFKKNRDSPLFKVSITIR